MLRSVSIVLVAIAVAGCGGNKKPVAEPELGGGESPYAFHRAIGLTLLRTKQPRRALPHLQRLVRLEPGKPEPLFYLGRAYMGMEMWPQARTAFERAIKLEPRYASAHAMLGVLFNIRGQHREAEAAHRAAIKIDPGNASYRNNLGFGRYLQGRYRDALAALLGALRRDPSMRRIHNNLGFVYGKLGKLDSARGHFRLAGSPAEAENNIGLVYEELGQLDRAYEAYVAAVWRAPELASARGNLERVCQRLGKPLPQIPNQREDDEDSTR